MYSYNKCSNQTRTFSRCLQGLPLMPLGRYHRHQPAPQLLLAPWKEPGLPNSPLHPWSDSSKPLREQALASSPKLPWNTKKEMVGEVQDDNEQTNERVKAVETQIH